MKTRPPRNGSSKHLLRWGVSLCVCAAVLALCAVGPSLPGVALAKGDPSGVIVQDVDLAQYPRVSLEVVVPASLSKGGTPVFSVTENGRDVEVLKASVKQVDQSIDAVLVLDTSGSMKGRALEAAKRAASAFIAELQPPSRAALVVFSDRPKVLVPTTSDKASLERAVQGIDAEGETALYDAVALALRQVSSKGGSQPAVVVLSDGADTRSRASLTGVLQQIKAANVPVLAVALKSREADPASLKMLARANAGRVQNVSDVDSLAQYYSGLARELQTRFAVVYNSKRPSTMDLDIVVTADGASGTAVGESVVRNPVAAYEGPLDSAVKPAPRANLVTYALAILLVFVSVGLLIAALALLLIKPSTGLDKLTSYDQAEAGELGGRGTHTDAVMTGVISAIDFVAGKGGFKRLAYDELDRAGLPLRPTEFIGAHIALVIGSGLVVGLVSQNMALSLVVVVLATLIPIMWISLRIQRRHTEFEAQLPDTLDLIAGSLRAGWGLQQALEAVVEQAKPPISEEFKRAQTEVRLGRSVEQSLGSVAHRMQSMDFDWVVSAIAIQREVGGNLAELLTIVANTIRERNALKRQVSALTSEGRLSAVILFVLPFFEAAVLFVMNPGYISQLFTTGPGYVLLTLGAMLMMIGGLWLRQVIKVEV